MAINPGIWLEIVIYGVLAWMMMAIFKMLIDSTQFRSKEKKPSEPSNEQNISTKGEPLNLAMMIMVLLLVMIFIRIKVGFELDGTTGDYPAWIMAIVPLCLLGFLVVFNLIEYARGIKKVRRWGHKSERNELAPESIKKIDRNRKIFHFIAMGLLFMALSVGNNYLSERAATDPLYAEQLEMFWGSKDGLNYLEYTFIRHSVPMGQTLMIMWMYGTALVLLAFEITRLSNKWHFILHREVQGWLRYKEIDTFAAFTHFAVGYLFAAIILPPILFLASMCLITFADPASSTIGIKFGKHRFSWNKKSLEGLIAGTVAAFATMYVFVGPIYALVGAFGFALIDLITPKPVQISDNMAMPLICTALFVILSLLGVPSQNYLGW